MKNTLICAASSRVSLERASEAYDFGPAAAAAARVAEAVLKSGLPARTFLNINVPSGQPRGVRITFQAKRNHVTVVSERVDPRSRPYYWIEEGGNEWEPHDRSDYQAVRDGYISITTLQPDMTAHAALSYVEGLPLTSQPLAGRSR